MPVSDSSPKMASTSPPTSTLSQPTSISGTAAVSRPANGNVAIPAVTVVFPSFRSHISAAKAIGERPSQQDEFLVIHVSPLLVLLAIFDGHGSEGGKVASFLHSWISSNASSFLADGSPSTSNFSEREFVTNALTEMFAKLSIDLKSSSGIDCYLSGSTALIAILSPSRLYVANLGDSSAIISSKFSHFPINSPDLITVSATAAAPPPVEKCYLKLIVEHNCENLKERDRVLASGARIDRMESSSGNAEKTEEHNGPLRIYQATMPYPGLVVTRSLGDDVAHRVGVLSVPEITVHELTRGNDIIVLASDGLWDACSPEEVINTIRVHIDGPNGSNALSKRGVEKNIRELLTLGLRCQRRKCIVDNISIVCALLDHSKLKNI